MGLFGSRPNCDECRKILVRMERGIDRLYSRSDRLEAENVRLAYMLGEEARRRKEMEEAMSDPITTLQAMIDSEANVTLQSQIRGTVGWSVWADCEDEPQEYGSEATLEAAVEAMADAVCRWDQDSDFARFHRGEINYFRCGICGQPCFGVHPVLDSESRKCCPECFAAACRDEE